MRECKPEQRSGCDYLRASKTRLKGVSVARRKCLNPPASTVSRKVCSDATAPKPGPPSASEFAVQHNVEAAEKVRPTGLKFSSTVLPAMGSTMSRLPSAAKVWHARVAAPRGSPMSWKQSKNAIRS
jgi:hypothetical protein